MQLVHLLVLVNICFSHRCDGSNKFGVAMTLLGR